MNVLGSSPLYSDPTAYTAYTIQTVSKKLLANTGSGNAMGIDSQDAPLVWYSIHMEYTATSLDSQLYNVARTAHNQIQTKVLSRNAVNKFIYINDAGADQKAILSYESPSVQKMKVVSAKYDPNGVFQKLCTGPFKLT